MVPTGHPFGRCGSVELEGLARHTVFGVVSSAPQYWWDFHVPPETPSGKQVRRGQSVPTFQELIALVAAGQGITPVAASVTRYFAHPGVAFVPLRDAPPTEVALVWRTAGLNSRVRAFAHAAADAVRANGGPAAF
ncbi:LysR substrate binding domain-containing protein [Saccharopolyspora antimicrobica]|uniref:LysR substrate binding domain-containing protein n=1 Tax=Saccharopolyspora antimicrobica TaxID=455193 RepID=A0A1I5DUL3_9PSEU|nr:LysR substrate-binding domain-containing protein [Saccharopolyspora antimicrobica]SFO02929.1 LysR substrate binding domain-containing protein [Saccharopolyspora antimicrobica]